MFGFFHLAEKHQSLTANNAPCLKRKLGRKAVYLINSSLVSIRSTEQSRLSVALLISYIRKLNGAI